MRVLMFGFKVYIFYSALVMGLVFIAAQHDQANHPAHNITHPVWTYEYNAK